MINNSPTNNITLKSQNLKQNRQQKNKTQNPQNKQKGIPGPFHILDWKT